MSASRQTRLATVTLDDQAMAIAGLLRSGPRPGLRPEYFPDPTARAVFEAVMLHRHGERRDFAAVERLVREEIERRALDRGLAVFETAVEFSILEAAMREHEIDRNARHLIEAAEYRRLLGELDGARARSDHALEAACAEKLADLERGERRGGEVVLVRASDLEEKPVEWLWTGYIPAGALTLLSSPPKCGKSTLTAAIAARVSRGALWPSGPALPSQPAVCAPCGDVLVIAYEDDLERTVIPRLIAAGADLDRVHFLRGVMRRRGKSEALSPIDLADHFEEIATIVRRHRVALVIVDPVMSGFSAGRDTNADNEVRAVLGPFTPLAEETRAAFLFVTHTNKRAEGSSLDSAIGSRAFTGICRMVLAVARFKVEAEGEAGRYRSAMLQSGGNLGAPRPGLVFEIKSQGGNEARAAVEFLEEFDGDADEFRAMLRQRERAAFAAEADTRQSKCNRAMLEIVERERWIESPELDAMLEGLGHNSRAIERARTALARDGRIDKRKCGTLWWTGLAGTEPQGDRFQAAAVRRVAEARKHPRSEGGGE
jgi:putative DNA primase/helicase